MQNFAILGFGVIFVSIWKCLQHN